MKMRTGRITLLWECDRCHIKASQPLEDIAEVGTAICEDCGDDMTLQEEVETKTDTITIHLEGGVVHGIEGIPPGVKITILNYDTNDIEEERITQTPHGEAVVTTYEGRSN